MPAGFRWHSPTLRSRHDRMRSDAWKGRDVARETDRCRRRADRLPRMVLPCRGSAGPPSLQDLRHGLLQRAPPDPAEQFERLQPAIQPDIVAAVLDDLAGVQDGGAVAVEYRADHAVAQLET